MQKHMSQRDALKIARALYSIEFATRPQCYSYPFEVHHATAGVVQPCRDMPHAKRELESRTAYHAFRLMCTGHHLARPLTPREDEALLSAGLRPDTWRAADILRHAVRDLDDYARAELARLFTPPERVKPWRPSGNPNSMHGGNHWQG